MKYSRQWTELDNAAKIFPPTSNRRDTKVFRFACELHEPVDPEILQQALDRTVEQFPFYRSILKKGLFWYYLETSPLRPVVEPERNPPCAPIYNGDRKTLLFHVTYYRRRINLEVYHALTDGTGALRFMQALVLHYLTQKHGISEEGIQMDYDASRAQKVDDSFSKYYSKARNMALTTSPKAYHIRGERFPEDRIGIVEGIIPAGRLLEEARRYDATLTEYLGAQLILAIHEGMSLREEARPVVLTIPVNLRKYFPSASARNFFGVIDAGYHFQQGGGTLEEVIAQVREALRGQLTPERLRDRMDRLSALEHNYAAKMMPLVLKDPVLRIANRISARGITAAFSNVGRITMPPEVADYIRLFDIFASTQRLQACLCSYQDNLLISFTSPFVDTDVQRCFFRSLTGRGIPVTITADLPGAEQEV